MAKPEEDVPPISEETLDMIDGQVKKGKARKFFLIYKGASIKTLVVFKKGAFGPKVMQAKKDGFKGEVCYGVVTGSGKNLFFQLPANGDVAAAMKVDGFCDKPPCKKTKLKEFLAGCGLAYKPSFHMITTLADAPDPESQDDTDYAAPPAGSEAGDDDAPPAAPPPPPQAAAAETQPTAANEAAPQSAVTAAEFMTRLKALKPDLDKVVAANVAASQDAKLKASEAGAFARQQDFDQASGALDELEELVKQGLAELAAQPAAAEGNAAEAFAARFKALLPQIKAAAGTPIGDEAKTKAGEAGGLARKQDFAAASQILDQVEELMARAATEAAAASTSPSAPSAQELAAQLTGLRPAIDALLQLMPGAKGSLYGSLTAIAGDIKAAKLEPAAQALEQLRTQVSGLESKAQPMQDRILALAPDLEDGKRFKPEDFSKLTAAFSMATESFQNGDVDRAGLILDRLQPRLAELLAQPEMSDAERMDIPDGIVEQRRQELEKLFRQRIDADKIEAQADVRRVESAVEQMEADPAPAELAAAIQEVLDDLYEQTADSLLAALESGSRKEVMNALAQERANIMNNELVQHLQSANSDLSVSIGVMDRFESLFSDVKAQVEQVAA